MLRTASRTIVKVKPGSTRPPKRSFANASSSRNASYRYSSNRNGLLVAGAGVTTAAAIWYFIHQDTIHLDAPQVKDELLQKRVSGKDAGVANVSEDGSLSSFVWGSNRTHLLYPDDAIPESVKTPTTAKWLQDVALRDLALHERHAACVDAKGDVYQWGDGYFGDSAGSSDRKPALTLRGKNIVKLQVTPTRVFALSASGRIYALASEAAKQTLPVGGQTPASTPWWSTGWLWDEEQSVDFTEITPNEKLGMREKFVSIAAGNDHLLALTSSGRTFAHPVNLNANAYGQLGLRKFDIPDPNSTAHPPGHARLPIELTPKAIADPYAKSTPAIRRRSDSESSAASDVTTFDDKSIRFSDKLFEIPALQGIKIDKIAAGARTSFVKTEDGRVLGWGANEYGQIGLGANVTLDTITVPTEVILWKNTPQSMKSTCVDIFAGGDLTFFKVERVDGSAMPYVDVLACGNGQWGGLGNAQYSNAQSTPVKAKNVSGLLEYSEQTKNLQAIEPHSISISPTGHVLLTLDTLSHSGPGGQGRDLFVWGANQEYQLGTGKRGSLATPRNLEQLDGERFILGKKKAGEVRDLGGKVWKKNVEVEQCAVAGYGNSVVYWKVCQ
ncbi:RCC1/BLIP-II [Panus rudis PR-1116 ss-1]|nr:RCC1/BLIP-II [Panus rudis PR-1116 ss-1]